MSDSASDRNRAYWDGLAPHRPGASVDDLRRGGALSAVEDRAVGDVRGRRVLHLACATGDEAIEFAVRGARVVAVDLARAHLEAGRAKATALGVEVEFIEQDMLALDPAITGFDVVFISSGGICWVPDLPLWCRMVVERLVLRGIVVISEHHPIWEVLAVRDADTVAPVGDYFIAERDGYPDPAKAPEVTRRLGAASVTPRSWVWGIGEVVTALVGAGLRIRSLQEDPDPEMYPGLRGAARLPATYVLVAEHPGPDAEGAGTDSPTSQRSRRSRPTLSP